MSFWQADTHKLAAPASTPSSLGANYPGDSEIFISISECWLVNEGNTASSQGTGIDRENHRNMGRGRSAPPGVWFRTESGILHINNSELRSFSPSWTLQFSKPLRHPTHHPRTHPNLLVLLYLLHVDLSIYPISLPVTYSFKAAMKTSIL